MLSQAANSSKLDPLVCKTDIERGSSINCSYNFNVLLPVHGLLLMNTLTHLIKLVFALGISEFH